MAWWQLVVFIVVTLAAATARAQEITVMPAAACEPGGGLPAAGCITLTNALQMATSNTILYLESGMHYVEQFTLINDVHNISMVGEGEGASVKITCSDGVGLAFVNITDLTIENIVIERCSLSGENLGEAVTLLNETVYLFYSVPLDIKIAVFLGQCENLRMENVTIANTTGIGLVGINIIGNSSLTNVDFFRNIRSDNLCETPPPTGSVDIQNDTERRGGGAYFLYQDYRPLSLVDIYFGLRFALDIEQSKFIENSECSYELLVETNAWDTTALQDVGYKIGNGGGLSIVLTQRYYGVDVSTTGSLFRNNTATFGGGAHVTLFDGVRDSHIEFIDCTFLRNGFTLEEFLDRPLSAFSAGAGGLSIASDVVYPEYVEGPLFIHERGLTVLLQNTTFSQNGGRSGGALYIIAIYQSAIADISDVVRFYINNCTFERNVGSTGAAMLLIELKLNARFLGIQVEVTDIVVTDNIPLPINSGVSLTQSNNPAAADIRAVNFTLYGTCVFARNQVTALQGNSAVIGITGNVSFEENSGVYGGAISLVTYSALILNHGSSLYIRNNVGRAQGGALYVNVLGSNSAIFYADCFLYFSYGDYTICDNCSDLNSTGVYVEIVDNRAPIGGIIYGSALEFCSWGIPLRQTYEGTNLLEILDHHFPHIFHFSPAPTGSGNVVTPSRNLVVENKQSLYRVIPGEIFYLNILANDSYNQSISTVVSAYVLNTSSDQPTIVQDVRTLVGGTGVGVLLGGNATAVPLQMFAEENQTVSVVLFATDSATQPQAQITIEIDTCPEPFVFVNETLTCDCNPELLARDISCNISNGSLIVGNNVWVGPVFDGDFVVHRCVNGYCEPGTRIISVRNRTTGESIVDYDIQCAVGLNRSGLLCGRCRDGYSIIFGSDRCFQCHNGFIAMIIVFGFLGIFLVLMISYLQITVTSGFLNGALFYSNIVSLYGAILTPADPYDSKLVLTSWLTLNFGIESCFHDNMSSLEKVWWQLSFPLYLFFLMLVITLLARCCRFRRGAGFSTIQAFATLILLCYVSILQSSAELLAVVQITTVEERFLLRWKTDPTVRYFRGIHGFLGFVGVILILFYIIPLPLLLLFPSLLYRIRYLNKFKPFYDAFWDPFEPSYRFWLGFRLIFRWIPFGLAFFATTPENTFFSGFFLALLLSSQLILRPFKGWWKNVSDGFFLVNLVILFMGSLYFNVLAESNGGRMRNEARVQATAFTTVFVSFAYIAFFVIFMYHLAVRFPKFKAALLKCKNCFKKKPKTVETVYVPELSYEVVGGENSDQTKTATAHEIVRTPHGIEVKDEGGQTRLVNFTDLREPLLEDEGSIEIITIRSQPAVANTKSKRKKVK